MKWLHLKHRDHREDLLRLNECEYLRETVLAPLLIQEEFFCKFCDIGTDLTFTMHFVNLILKLQIVFLFIERSNLARICIGLLSNMLSMSSCHYYKCHQHLSSNWTRTTTLLSCGFWDWRIKTYVAVGFPQDN